MGQLYIIRHCESMANRNNVISGQSDIPVTDCVIDMQECINTPFCNATILSSPLSRCIKTAETLKLLIGHTNDIIIDHRLIERGMGIWENEKKEKVIKQYPEYFSEQRFLYYKTPPEGESFDLFSKRISEFFVDLCHLLVRNDIIICSHNQTLKLLYAIIKKAPLESFLHENDFKNGVLVRLPQL